VSVYIWTLEKKFILRVYQNMIKVRFNNEDGLKVHSLRYFKCIYSDPNWRKDLGITAL